MSGSRSLSFLVVAGTAAGLVSVGWEAYNLRLVALMALIAAVVGQVALIRSLGLWAVPSLFQAILVLFHLGLAPFVILGVELPLPESPTEWIYTEQGRHAFWLAGVACVAFPLGALLVRRRRSVVSEGIVESDMSDKAQARLAWVGVLVLALSIGAWAAVCVSRLGLGFVGSSYDSYKAATATAPMDYLFLGISLGMVMLASSSVGTQTKVGLAIFGLFVLAGLPLGLRGEVLFPMTAFAGVLARHRPMPRLRTVVVVSLLILTVTANVKTLRQVGLSDIGEAQLGLTPLAGVAEMGYTLRTVQAEESWHETGVDPRMHGATYGAPFERLLGNLKILAVPLPAQADSRLMNVEMRAREGNIGGSVVAEAAHNFGGWGVFLLLFALGLAASALDAARVCLRTDLILGLVFTVMLQHVRNSFTPVPLQLLIGLVLFAVVAVVLRIHRLGPRKVISGGSFAASVNKR